MTTETVPSFRQQLTAMREAAIADFQTHPRPQWLLKTLCRSVDKILIALWASVGFPSTHTLVAVGGYGRGELFPYSDVDVLVLLADSPDEALNAKLEKFIQELWSLGLTIGHSVRTVPECIEEAANDITIQTSLLETRYLTGNRKLFHQMREHYDATMDPQAFFIAKTLETKQRHLKFGDTPYSLEPNCKEGPGGLRDLHVILWVAKAAKLGFSWNELAEKGLLTASEAQQLRKKERAFKDIRIRLHIQAKRAEDRLLFDLQMPVAETYGFRKKGLLLDARTASECMMKRYYRAAHSVCQLNMILLQNLQSRLFPTPQIPVRLNDRFNEVNGLLDIASDTVFTKHPSAIFEAFYLLSQRADLKEMTVRTLRAMWHARMNINRAFRNSRTNHAFFLKILQSERFAVRTLAYMNRMGILGRYLPNFGRIVGQMQYDLFHQFTVDQHTLKVLENLHHFSRARYAHENPLCSHLMTGFSRQWVLYVAALFHDIAKGRGGDHSQLGMRDARRFCVQHDMTAEDTELVVFLVKEHLTLSTYAQKRDLSDPDVINAFAGIVKDDRHLTALFLLTVADIQGTASNIWNAWKGKLMEDLLAQTKRVLGGEALSIDHELERRQQEAKAKLRLYGLPESAHDTFWKQLDIVYFLRNDASDIAWHTRSLYWQADAWEPIVKCRLSQVGEGLQVMVYMPDRPDLFALICSYFDRKNYAILDAKIHTTKQQYALDSFIVTRQGFEKNYRDITSQVEHDLTEILKSSGPLPKPSQPKLSRKSRIFPVTPSIDLRPDAGGRFVLSITGNDYRGLLYAIAWVFSRHRINLHTAKIMTLGERIEDVFLIDGETLQQPRLQIQFERDMIDVLRTPAG